MLGAIAGDVIGSYYECYPIKKTDFPLFHPDCRFTDDTVLTVAVADWILNGGDLADYFHSYFADYPLAGYGMSFARWAGLKLREPYNSWGNGAAMRVSPIGFACDTLEDVLEKAAESAEVTHNHPEGIRGAQSTAAAIFLARMGFTKPEIKDAIETRFGYDLGRMVADIRPDYGFDVSCQGSVPESIISFLESTDHEQSIRIAVSLGGDADTMACIAGGIAEAYFGSVSEPIQERVFEVLNDKFLSVIQSFLDRFSRD